MSSHVLLSLAVMTASAAAALLSGLLCYKVGQEAATNDARDAGHAEGFEEGHDEGRDHGYLAGKLEGVNRGYRDGHADGKRVGRAEVLTAVQARLELLTHPEDADGADA